MTARAYVREDIFHRGVSIVISPQDGWVLEWGPVTQKQKDESTAYDTPEILGLKDDVARALYEALAQYYGGNAADVRHLRGDYDAERKRVDKMIDAFIKGQV